MKRSSNSCNRLGKRLEVVPSKVVITLKPGPRRKIRLVACGNFVDRTCEEEKDRCLYASGADAVCIRYVLKRAAEEDWKASVMDIRVCAARQRARCPHHGRSQASSSSDQDWPCAAQRVLLGTKGHVWPQAVTTMLGIAPGQCSPEDEV